MSSKYDINMVYKTKQGCTIKIINKTKVGYSMVKFLDDYGYEVEVKNSSISRGTIRNPYYPSVCGIGYRGVGEYKVSINSKATKEYETWRSMLVRCYDSKYQNLQPTYVGTTVYSEWLNFQNFAKWHKENFPNIENIFFELDKDLLQKNIENKIYSPETCVFLPNKINTFIIGKQSNNTSGYIGVSWDKPHSKWKCNINDFKSNKYLYLGLFKNIKDAVSKYENARDEQAEYAKEYLRELKYLPENIIALIK